jgi:hypothetical protein
MTRDSSELQTLLRERFGHQVFRDGQEHVVRALHDAKTGSVKLLSRWRSRSLYANLSTG